MTVDELREELDGVPGHYRVFVVREGGQVTQEAGDAGTRPPHERFYVEAI